MINLRFAGLLGVVLGMLCLSTPAFSAGNRIQINVDKTRLTLGDVLNCEVTVTLEDEDAVEDVRMPDFSGFKVLNSSSSRQVSTSIINFKMTSSRITTTTSLLSPLNAGTLRIGPASIKEKQGLIRSNTVEVHVIELDSVDASRLVGDEAISAPFSQAETETPNMFVRFVPERSELVEGELMAITLYLYTSGVSPSRWGQVAPPVFDGFLSDQLELEKNRNVRNVNIDGRNFRVEPLDRYLLTAVKAGIYTIAPYRAKVLVNDRSFFNGNWAYRATAPVEITVSALPTEGRPPGFINTHVGRFKLTASLDRRRTEVGQPVNLKLTLSGNTNMDRITMPNLPPISGAKTYPPTLEKDNYQQGTRIVGQRTAEYLVMPTREGTLTIPPVSFVFFDSEKGVYREISTRNFKILADKATGAAPGNSPQGVIKQELELKDGSLKPLAPKAELVGRQTRFFDSSLFLSLFALPILLIGLIFFVDLARFAAPRLISRDNIMLERECRRLRQGLLIDASKDDKSFASDFSKWLYLELERTFAVSMSGLTYDQIAERLQLNGVNETLRSELEALFQTCDLMRYSLAGSADGKSLIDRAERWLKEARK